MDDDIIAASKLIEEIKALEGLKSEKLAVCRKWSGTLYQSGNSTPSFGDHYFPVTLLDGSDLGPVYEVIDTAIAVRRAEYERLKAKLAA